MINQDRVPSLSALGGLDADMHRVSEVNSVKTEFKTAQILYPGLRLPLFHQLVQLEHREQHCKNNKAYH